ncbi:MAG: hypothetical protein H0T51_21575 [Pirellulales bacterium]|nr:hypothetical protein [Pirellulales bacterium]
MGYRIVTSSGNQSVSVNQETGGGTWKNLGSFNLSAGDYNVVGVSRWTEGAGYVIADAVRVRNSQSKNRKKRWAAAFQLALTKPATAGLPHPGRLGKGWPSATPGQEGLAIF